ncbi:hypothetical protein GE09DRAFT_1049702 [Coniochaeta sp. 2T2.1]|nr:hypothetical protein GE09DRAFT_1049702 [Coniochaeta sp. 2T2.1]
MPTQDNGRTFVGYNSNSSRRKQVVGGNVSPRSTPEEDSSDEEATDSGSASDSEEETIISDEIQEDQVGLNSKTDSPVSNKSQVSGEDEKLTIASVQPALLGEIRKMIQEEFGLLKSIVASPEAKPDPREDVAQPLASPRPGLRIETQQRLSPPSGSPVQGNAKFSPASPRGDAQARLSPPPGSPIQDGRFSPSSPRGDRPRIERSVTMGVTPSSPERQILVRFAEEEKQVAAGRAGRTSPTSKAPQLSAIDEKWGQLFDERGHSTKRLEQVLRGLANYMIDEFMPQKSIVIPPDKMAALYSHHRVEDERNPFTAIFKCRSKGWSIGLEDIYRDLGCEYYLIPKDAKSRPSVPSLTPSGFAKWMTANILAYPDAEAKRLNHIVSELPINADGPWHGITERLPKQISRHLFPEKPDRKARRLLDDVLRDFVEEFLPPRPLHTGKESPTRQQQGTPRIEIVSEKRLSASSAPTSSPRTAKYMPEPPRSRANSSSSPQPPPMRLGRAYSDDPARLSLVHHSPDNNNNKLPPPPLGRSTSSAARRRASSPVDPYRRSVAEIARANSPVPGSPGVVADAGRGEGEQYQQYVPSRADYAPKSSVERDRATPRRVAVVQGEGGGNPGPTWDEYLSGRQGAARGGFVYTRAKLG